MKESDIHSLIVLQYLQLGIVPYYPGHGVLLEPDKKTKRKFRKIWRKASREIGNFDILVSSNETPSKGLLGYRQSVVYNWIRRRVIKAHRKRF